MQTKEWFQYFFKQLPLGSSALQNTKGESILIEKNESHITLSKEESFASLVPRLGVTKRLHCSFVPVPSVEGTYALNDCWEDGEEAYHYPASETNQLMVEWILADVLQDAQAVVA
ncbi:MAG: hypothetical protein HEQ32_07550 [Vampirovibrio sp.]